MDPCSYPRRREKRRGGDRRVTWPWYLPSSLPPLPPLENLDRENLDRMYPTQLPSPSPVDRQLHVKTLFSFVLHTWSVIMPSRDTDTTQDQCFSFIQVRLDAEIVIME